MMVVLAASPALADTDYDIYGFMTYGTGELTGQVTDGKGKPVSAEVKISGANGTEQRITSDARGTFRVKLDGGAYSIIYTDGSLKVSGQVALPRVEGDTEVVEIHDTMVPARMPRPKSDPRKIPEFSAEAKDRDQWTRAWLMLDIDAAGNVTRLKLLKKPGFGLDAIAVKAGMALKFDPAVDRAGNKIRSLAVWVFDWPQWSWLTGRHAWDGNLSRSDVLPAAAGQIMCRGSGPPRDVMRDCSTPPRRAMFDAPWQDRP